MFAQNSLIGVFRGLQANRAIEVITAERQIVVTPNMNPHVGRQVLEHGMIWYCVVTNPSEAFAASEPGAHMLKCYPAKIVSPSALRAMRAVLAKNAQIATVSRITPDKMEHYLIAGALGIGFTSALAN